MKRILSSLLLLLALTLAGTGRAHAQSVRLFLHSGDTLKYDCAEVDSIVFDDATPTGPAFSLEYDKLTSTTVTLRVTPADNDVRYYYDVVTTDQLAESHGSIAEVVEGYISYLQQTYPTLSVENILDALLAKGPDSDDLTGLPAGTDFVFYAIAVNDEGKCYGQPTTTTFTTLPAGDPADCTFTIDYANLTSDGLTVKVTPSDASVRYWMGITAVDEYPGDYAMTANVKTEIAAYAADKGMTVAQVVKGVTFTGECSSAESGLQANTDYYIYVYAMDETGDSAGKVYKKRFSTRVTDYSDADVSLKYRYFDGDELYALDSEKYANLQGRVYVQAVITPNETASNWALALASGDMTDETTYPEESTKNAILQAGSLNVETKYYVADWKTCTFLYFAADANGIDGQLHRLLVTFEKDGAMPASQLETGAAAATKALRMPMTGKALSPVVRRMAGRIPAGHRGLLR